jgi:hypothetical protein
MARKKELELIARYNTNKEVRKEIDKCLHKINANRAKYIGTDSTEEDFAVLKSLNDPLKEKIKEIDPVYYETLYLSEMELNNKNVSLKILNLLIKEKNKDKKEALIESLSFLVSRIDYSVAKNDIEAYLDEEIRDEYFSEDGIDISTPELFINYLLNYY